MLSVIEFLCLPLEEQLKISFFMRYMLEQQSFKEEACYTLPYHRSVFFTLLIHSAQKDFLIDTPDKEVYHFIQSLIKQGESLLITDIRKNLSSEEYGQILSLELPWEQHSELGAFIRARLHLFLQSYQNLKSGIAPDMQLAFHFWWNSYTDPLSPFLIQALMDLFVKKPIFFKKNKVLPLKKTNPRQKRYPEFSLYGLFSLAEDIIAISEGRKNLKVEQSFKNLIITRCHGTRPQNAFLDQLQLFQFCYKKNNNRSIFLSSLYYQPLVLHEFNPKNSDFRDQVYGFVLKYAPISEDQLEIFIKNSLFLSAIPEDSVADLNEDQQDLIFSETEELDLTPFGENFLEKDEMNSSDLYDLAQEWATREGWTLSASLTLLQPFFYHHPDQLWGRLRSAIFSKSELVFRLYYDFSKRFFKIKQHNIALKKIATWKSQVQNGGYYGRALNRTWSLPFLDDRYDKAFSKSLYKHLAEEYQKKIENYEHYPKKLFYEFFSEDLLIALFDRSIPMYTEGDYENYLFFLKDHCYDRMLIRELSKQTSARLPKQFLRDLMTVSIKYQAWPFLNVLLSLHSLSWPYREWSDILYHAQKSRVTSLPYWYRQKWTITIYFNSIDASIAWERFFLRQWIPSYQEKDLYPALKEAISQGDAFFDLIWERLIDNSPEKEKTLSQMVCEQIEVCDPISEKKELFFLIERLKHDIPLTCFENWIQSCLSEEQPLLAYRYLEKVSGMAPILEDKLAFLRVEILLFILSKREYSIEHFPLLLRATSALERFIIAYDSALKSDPDTTKKNLFSSYHILNKKTELNQLWQISWTADRRILLSVLAKKDFLLLGFLIKKNIEKNQSFGIDEESIFSFLKKDLTLEIATFFFMIDPRLYTEPDKQGLYAIHYFIENQASNLVKSLISRDPRLYEVETGAGKDLMFFTIQSGNTIVFDYLIQNCPLESWTSFQKNEPLAHLAVKSNALAIYQILLQYPSLMCQADQHGYLPIHYVIFSKKDDWWILSRNHIGPLGLWEYKDHSQENLLFTLFREGWLDEIYTLVEKKFVGSDAFLFPNSQGRNLFELYREYQKHSALYLIQELLGIDEDTEKQCTEFFSMRKNSDSPLLFAITDPEKQNSSSQKDPLKESSCASENHEEILYEITSWSYSMKLKKCVHFSID